MGKQHAKAKPFYLCYYSDFIPKDHAMNPRLPPVDKKLAPKFRPPPVWSAISINYLRGYDWRQIKDRFSYFQKYEPVAIAGYSIYIFHIEELSLNCQSDLRIRYDIRILNIAISTLNINSCYPKNY